MAEKQTREEIREDKNKAAEKVASEKHKKKTAEVKEQQKLRSKADRSTMKVRKGGVVTEQPTTEKIKEGDENVS